MSVLQEMLHKRVVELHLICRQAGEYKVVLCIRRSL